MLQAEIYIQKDELWGTQSLYEFILHFLIRQNVKGSTVFEGKLGFGKNHHLKRPNELFSFDDTPMMIMLIDEDEKIKATLTELRKVWEGGFIITHQVEQWK
jgi:uncharacterized protein